MQEVLREQVFDEVKDDINPKLDKKDVENKRVLFWQGETIKSRKDLTDGAPQPSLRCRADVVECQLRPLVHHGQAKRYRQGVIRQTARPRPTE